MNPATLKTPTLKPKHPPERKAPAPPPKAMQTPPVLVPIKPPINQPKLSAPSPALQRSAPKPPPDNNLAPAAQLVRTFPTKASHLANVKSVTTAAKASNMYAAMPTPDQQRAANPLIPPLLAVPNVRPAYDVPKVLKRQTAYTGPADAYAYQLGLAKARSKGITSPSLDQTMAIFKANAAELMPKVAARFPSYPAQPSRIKSPALRANDPPLTLAHQPDLSTAAVARTDENGQTLYDITDDDEGGGVDADHKKKWIAIAIAAVVAVLVITKKVG